MRPHAGHPALHVLGHLRHGRQIRVNRIACVPPALGTSGSERPLPAEFEHAEAPAFLPAPGGDPVDHGDVRRRAGARRSPTMDPEADADHPTFGALHRAEGAPVGHPMGEDPIAPGQSCRMGGLVRSMPRHREPFGNAEPGDEQAPTLERIVRDPVDVSLGGRHDGCRVWKRGIRGEGGGLASYCVSPCRCALLHQRHPRTPSTPYAPQARGQAEISRRMREKTRASSYCASRSVRNDA